MWRATSHRASLQNAFCPLCRPRSSSAAIHSHKKGSLHTGVHRRTDLHRPLTVFSTRSTAGGVDREQKPDSALEVEEEKGEEEEEDFEDDEDLEDDEDSGDENEEELSEGFEGFLGDDLESLELAAAELEGAEVAQIELTAVEEAPEGHKSGYVGIVGMPNAGKSTLMNSLLEQKLSSVTSKAQTTRHKIMGILTESNFQLMILDTPGVLKVQNSLLDTRMMDAVQQTMRDADALVFLVDASKKPKDTLNLLTPLVSFAKAKSIPTCLALNKVDLVDKPQAEDLARWFEADGSFNKVLNLSALQNSGVTELKEWAVSQIPEGPILYPKDDVSEMPERFFIAEIVRENIFKQYFQEIPYSCTVQVLDYKERGQGQKDFVEVAVIVEEERHRGILIGKNGSAIKQLSTASRRDIEEFVDKEVYLDLSIKVASKWRSDQELLNQLGY